MALALPNDGKLYALDISEEFTSVGKPFWKKANVDNKINLIIAPASESLDKLLETERGQIDFAFIDAVNIFYFIFNFNILHFFFLIYFFQRTNVKKFYYFIFFF